MKRIIYCGAYRLHRPDAAGLRVLSNAKSLKDAGFEVELISWREQDNSTQGGEVVPFEVDGFRGCSVGELRGTKMGPAQRAVGFLLKGRKTLDFLAKQELGNVEAIICYNANSFFLVMLARLCKSRNIQLIPDCTEWYEPEHLPGGKYGLVAADEWVRMRCLMPRMRKAIVISSFLEKHYQRYGVELLRIPPTIDSSSARWKIEEWPKKKAGRVDLIYAGNPGRKDKLCNVLEAVAANKAATLKILGPDRQEVYRLLGESSDILDKLGSRLTFLGRVTPNEVPTIVARSDFSIIFREDARYAKAGFPTKLVESFASGTPAISTITGDEGLHLSDRTAGVVVPFATQRALEQAVKTAVAITPQAHSEMRRRAIELAKKHFDYRNYTEPLSSLISK